MSCSETTTCTFARAHSYLVCREPRRISISSGRPKGWRTSVAFVHGGQSGQSRIQVRRRLRGVLEHTRWYYHAREPNLYQLGFQQDVAMRRLQYALSLSILLRRLIASSSHFSLNSPQSISRVERKIRSFCIPARRISNVHILFLDTFCPSTRLPTAPPAS